MCALCPTFKFLPCRTAGLQTDPADRYIYLIASIHMLLKWTSKMIHQSNVSQTHIKFRLRRSKTLWDNVCRFCCCCSSCCCRHTTTIWFEGSDHSNWYTAVQTNADYIYTTTTTTTRQIHFIMETKIIKLSMKHEKPQQFCHADRLKNELHQVSGVCVCVCVCVWGVEGGGGEWRG